MRVDINTVNLKKPPKCLARGDHSTKEGNCIAGDYSISITEKRNERRICKSLTSALLVKIPPLRPHLDGQCP
jgi:hypothetical protein